MEDQKIEIDSEDWPKLCALYQSNTDPAKTTIDNYIRWINKESKIDNLVIYSLNNDWSDGTFVVVDRYHIYFNSLNASSPRLLKLLLLIDYSKGFRFMHVASKHYSTIKEVIELKRLTLEYDDPNLLYHLSKEKALNLEIEMPNNSSIRSLNLSDAAKANERWPFSHSGSLFYLQRLARLNPSCGVFINDGELVSSAFQFQTGPLGVLHTNEQYRGQGLATAVVKSIFKQTAELGNDCFACVKRSNGASRAVFEKLGCEIVDEVHWIATTCDWIDE